MAPPPIVTGLSPNEGPPGTRIKIRGENFGSQPSDLIGLTICGMDCLLTAEWKSPNKIIAISGPIKGKGDVIVTTKYGGTGTCNVTFRGYHLATIGPLKESAVWVEETPIYSWGRHSLSPSSFQQEDPLGLSVEEAENKISEEELLGYFPGKCGDIGSQHFSPAWFLLENHQTTSFNDLKAGLNHLTRKVQSQKEGQLSFLKANLNSVMDQIDTLMNLREKYEKESSVFGSTPTIKLERAIKESEREARKLFDDVLARKDRAEKTRNALNVLQRYKFLFCLPCVIERNVEYKHMVLTAIESFSKYVRVSIIPNTLDKSDRVQYGSLTTLDRDEVALLIEDVIQIVKESALSVEQRETSLLDSSSAQKELEKQVDNILGSFYDVLNNLSSTEDYDDCDDNSPVVSQLIGTPVGPHKTGAPHDIPTWENRLLITLSNCIFTKITILDEISKKFRETGFSSIDGPIKMNKNKYESLEKSILDKYLEQKSDPLVGTIEPSMYLGRFDWDINVPPTDIRPYAKECVNNLISVHSEINNISVNLLDSILVKIVETIAEELYRLMSCAQKFSKEGAQQAVVDIECLQWIFTNYLSQNAKSHFKEALAHVPELNKSDKLLVEDILKQCKVRMKTQILCLRKK
ncbi:unnamed protein product [Diabrotica balteata]|uniref:Exocyst complex component 2 n=1 Tax=Diabrotica balteata TaxID=107213 RepID=A0A9N9SUN4_DIABA|nr:unnamed protein product [Diabrotica balteata]